MLILQGLVLVRISKQGKQLSSDELHEVCVTTTTLEKRAFDNERACMAV